MVLLTNISFTFWVVAYGSFDCIVQRSGGSRPSVKGGGGEGAGHPHPEIRGGQSPKKFFLPFEPHFGRKIRGGPRALPWIRHCCEKACACIVKWEGVCIQPECVRL